MSIMTKWNISKRVQLATHSIIQFYVKVLTLHMMMLKILVRVTAMK